MKPKATSSAIPYRNHNRVRGFTLVEVIVVISIIMVLALLVVVMTQKIKQKAYQAKAMSPLTQTSAACMAYALENNGDINTVVDEKDARITQGGNWVKKSFWGALAPNIFSGLNVNNDLTSGKAMKQNVAAFFSTPDAKTMIGTFQGGAQGTYADTCSYVPFTFNSNVFHYSATIPKYHKMSQYDNPSQTLYMTYGRYTFKKKDGDKYSPLPKTAAERTANNNSIDWFSNRTAAFVFLDGHVEILSPPLADRLYSVKPTTN